MGAGFENSLNLWLNSKSQEEWVKNTEDLIKCPLENRDQDSLRRLGKIFDETVLKKDIPALRTFLDRMSQEPEDRSKITQVMLQRLQLNLSENSLSNELSDFNNALSKMIGVTQESQNKAALMKAVKAGDVGAIKELMSSNKMNLNFRNNEGATPLGVAILYGRTEAAKVLLDAGAKVDMADSRGWTPLITAFDMKYKDFFQLLKILKGSPANIGQKDNIKLLIEKGADVNAQNNDGDTPLIQAVTGDDIDSVTLLLAQERINLEERNVHGNTALFTAIYSRRKDVAKLLIEKGADLNAQNNNGFTPLMVAAAQGDRDGVELLLKNNANAHLINYLGRTALVYAALHMQKEVYHIMEAALDPSELLRQKEILKIISVAHSTNQWGVSQLHAIGKDFTSFNVFLEGSGKSSYWFKKFSEATKLISSNHSELLSNNELEDLLQLFNTGMEFDFATVMQRLEKGLPVLLSTGYNVHEVEVLVWGNYFILCNKGGSSRKNVEVFQFNKGALNKEVILNILQCSKQSEEFYKKFFFEELPFILGFKPQGEFEKSLEQACNLIPQVVGNCPWASSETAVWAFFVLRELIGANTINNEQIEKIKKSEKFHTWLVFTQMYILESYLGAKRVSVIDYSLVSRAIKEIEVKLHRDIQNEQTASKVRRSLHEMLAKSISIKIEGVDEVMSQVYFDEVKTAMRELYEF